MIIIRILGYENAYGIKSFRVIFSGTGTPASVEEESPQKIPLKEVLKKIRTVISEMEKQNQEENKKNNYAIYFPQQRRITCENDVVQKEGMSDEDISAIFQSITKSAD